MMPKLPSFATTCEGQDLAVSILLLEETAGFKNSLVHGKRIPWFDSKSYQFYAARDIIYRYQMTATIQLQRNFKEVENVANTLYNKRDHQADETGGRDKK